jgi:hypothetical protein
MSFATITLCVAYQLVFIVVVYFIIDSVWKLLDTPSYNATHMRMFIIYQGWYNHNMRLVFNRYIISSDLG